MYYGVCARRSFTFVRAKHAALSSHVVTYRGRVSRENVLGALLPSGVVATNRFERGYLTKFRFRPFEIGVALYASNNNSRETTD